MSTAAIITIIAGALGLVCGLLLYTFGRRRSRYYEPTAATRRIMAQGDHWHAWNDYPDR